jgi:hypothetical protein
MPDVNKEILRTTPVIILVLGNLLSEENEKLLDSGAENSETECKEKYKFSNISCLFMLYTLVGSSKGIAETIPFQSNTKMDFTY